MPPDGGRATDSDDLNARGTWTRISPWTSIRGCIATPDPDRHRERIRSRIASGWPQIGGVWVVERRDERGFLGWCGLFPLGYSGLIEIGYRYLPAAWGQGIASEAARRVLEHGFHALALDSIVAVTHPENRASQRVLEKIGLRPECEAFFYGQWLRFFRLSLSDYLARHRRSGASSA